MALDVDGYAVLQAMASAPEAFPDIRTEIPKAARALVVKQLKARALRVASLRLIREVLGSETFALIADGMSEAEVKGVVTRLDPHHPSLKTATPGWHRHRLSALAAGDAPFRKGETRAEDDPAKLRAGETPPERALASRPFSAVWDGKDHDAPPTKDSREKKDKEKDRKGKKKKG
ncbi:hypothetical protein [Methylorubrum extorquens]|uniref:hypothetical protein n=1 Tax=Methylorubrum extorquens TaxID=408 RepID=UPI000158EE53|nr:hypothetical protein [Methylorubrum extorquens]ABY33148.1 hypothetical protein Mext_4780 [Methylorubrum extorquens PA1]KQP86367.1 hypothetical protein ASF55_14325 [Methylobacterium sp. Leaf119]WIU39724.1 hypothetical protein KQ926_24690 [Methylorubrum extorquens]